MAPHAVVSKEQPKKGIQGSKHNPLNETAAAMAGNTIPGKSADTTGLRPTHFLIRPRLSAAEPALIVPLIPVDLLPEYIDIDGVSRHLTAAQATGMDCVGSIDRPSGSASYHLRFLSTSVAQIKGDMSIPVASASGIEMDMISTSSSGSAADGEGTSSTSVSLHSSDTEPDVHPLKGPKKKPNTSSPKTSKKSAISPSPTPSHIDRILASASAAAAHHLTTTPGKKNKKDKQYLTKSVPDAPSSSSQEKEKNTTQAQPTHQSPAVATTTTNTTTGNYCRHFCHHGTCKWGLQCRYQHTMPTTPEGLREVGLREWPAWLLRSIRVAENLNAAGGGMPFPAAQMHAPFHHAAGMVPMGGMMPMAPFAGMAAQQHQHQQHHQGQGQQQQQGKTVVSAAERKKREERQVKRAEERMKALEVERAEAERMERVRAARAMKMSNAHADAAAAALREGEGLVEVKLVDI